MVINYCVLCSKQSLNLLSSGIEQLIVGIPKMSTNSITELCNSRIICALNHHACFKQAKRLALGIHCIPSYFYDRFEGL